MNASEKEKRKSSQQVNDVALKKKLKHASSSVHSAPAICFKDVLKFGSDRKKTGIPDELPESFFDTDPAEQEKSKIDVALEFKYQELKKEVESMPFPENYRDEHIEDIEELIDRDEEVAYFGLSLAEKLEKLKEMRKNTNPPPKTSIKNSRNDPKKDWSFVVDDVFSDSAV